MAPTRANPPLKPLDAFRIILRAIYPQRPELADEIKEIRWFHYPKRHGVTAEESTAAWAALSAIKENVREHKIRLRGILKANDAPHDIDPIDIAEGELDIWEQTLEVSTKGVEKLYRQIHCVADDVRRLAKSVAGESISKSRGRPPAADWNGIIRKELFVRLNYLGPPSADDENPKWRTQADAERAVAEICESKGYNPVESVVRDHTRRLISEFIELKKAGKSLP